MGITQFKILQLLYTVVLLPRKLETSGFYFKISWKLPFLSGQRTDTSGHVHMFLNFENTDQEGL